MYAIGGQHQLFRGRRTPNIAPPHQKWQVFAQNPVTKHVPLNHVPAPRVGGNMIIKAFLFDLDGTLLDTNERHARAYAQAFEAFGYDISSEQVVTYIGMGGDRLVPRLIGDAADKKDGEAIRDRKREFFSTLIGQEGAPVLPGAVELLDAVRDRGIQTAIATGSKQSAVQLMMEHAQVDLAEHVDVVTTDTDVEHSKPHPDTPRAALEKLGVDASAALMLGDTPYDAQAATAAGVVPIGVLTGVHPQEKLREAGMKALYENAAEVHRRLDDVLSSRATSTSPPA